MPQVFYLHGFASSPDSSKARFLASRLAERGVRLQVPDLNEPDFSTLTTTRMIRRVAALLRPDEPIVLVGSSLGAFVALHLAEELDGRAPSGGVDRLVLLAPAFDFGSAGMGTLGPDGLARWQAEGWLEMPHYAYGDTRRVHFELYADGGRYDSFNVRTTVPMLILQGRRDAVVDPGMVERFAASRPHAQLVMLDDDHQLSDSHERVWSEVERFLGLAREP